MNRDLILGPVYMTAGLFASDLLRLRLIRFHLDGISNSVRSHESARTLVAVQGKKKTCG